MPIRAIISEGEKYNRLTIIREVPHKNTVLVGGKSYVLRRFECRCDCGKIVEVNLSCLRNGNNKSCGCLKYENISGENGGTYSHGLSNTPLYHIWCNIISRCYDKSQKAYKNYGGRGIKMCDKWRGNFKEFYDWAINNGWEKGLEIDRYPDNDGDYSELNCRIATAKMNANNKRTNVFLRYNSEKITVAELAEKLNINYPKVHQRIKKLKWDLYKAFELKNGENISYW